MRIAVSNPDLLGDLVIRQPMIGALEEAGHELLLVVRERVAPLAEYLFPRAKLVTFAGDPHLAEFEPAEDVAAAVVAFRPEVFVVAAYQHTRLEERMAEALPDGCSVIGFNGFFFPDGESRLRLTTTVNVAETLPEVEKNALLCAAILGKDLGLGRPRMAATLEGLAEARERLAELGLDGGPFWAVAAGDTPAARIKNWRPEKWAEFCRRAVEEKGLRLLFTGTMAEHESTEAIRAAMGEAGRRTATMTGREMSLAGIIGLLSMAEGYIGRDSGPMHIAAALRKTVVAVFGGGNWPRFVPAAETGAVFTVKMPCAGCGWQCHLETPECSTHVPVERVLRAVGERRPFQVEELSERSS